MSTNYENYNFIIKKIFNNTFYINMLCSFFLYINITSNKYNYYIYYEKFNFQ